MVVKDIRVTEWKWQGDGKNNSHGCDLALLQAWSFAVGAKVLGWL